MKVFTEHNIYTMVSRVTEHGSQAGYNWLIVLATALVIGTLVIFGLGVIGIAEEADYGLHYTILGILGVVVALGMIVGLYFLIDYINTIEPYTQHEPMVFITTTK